MYTKMTANIHTHSAQHALSSAKPIGLFYESVLRPEAAGTLSNVTELGTIYRAKEGRSINSSRILYDRMECLPSCPSLSIFSISTTFADWEGCCVGIWRNVTLSLSIICGIMYVYLLERTEYVILGLYVYKNSQRVVASILRSWRGFPKIDYDSLLV